MKNEIFIGPVIKQKLKEARYSLTQLAEEIGQSKQTTFNI